MSVRGADYESALRYLYSFADYERTQPRARDVMKLTGVRALLSALGDPHRALRAIHVAGTKGKGSTSAMLTSILRAAGYSTGTYTSPHLHSHRERYLLEGQPVRQERFVQLVADAQQVIDSVHASRPLTTYDISTALAFRLFAEEQVEWSVVEVGLGGRLDATNVLSPRLSVITHISLDHTEVLGTSLAEIAAEKAGIIKPGVPVVVSPQPEEALAVIRRVAAGASAALYEVSELAGAAGREVTASRVQRFRLRMGLALRGGSLDGAEVQLALLGPHQVDNALTAIVSAAVLPDAAQLTADALLRGIAGARWPGRFEIVDDRVPIVLDGAHNPDSVLKLRRTMDEVFPGRPVRCVFGAGLGHDAEGMLRELDGYRMVLCRSAHPRAMPLERLAALADAARVEYATKRTVPEALEAALTDAGRDVVLVCGTLFVVAEAREALGLAEAADPVRS